MAVERQDSPFDCLPTEIIIEIFSGITNIQSVLALGRTSSRLQAALKENESIIAHNIGVGLLEDDDLWVVKLAFMACEARLVRKSSATKARELIETYVSEGKAPLHAYRLRALRIMEHLSINVDLLIDWTATYGVLWPLKLDFKGYTATEVSRQRKIFFMLEACFTTIGPLSIDNRVEVGKLGERFWSMFTSLEFKTAYFFVRHTQYAESYCWRGPRNWSRGIRRGEGEVNWWPWHAHSSLYRELMLLRFSRWGDEFNNRFPRVGFSSNCMPFWSYFYDIAADDQSILLDRIALHYSERQLELEEEWERTEFYYDPLTFRHYPMHNWFFKIGDEDRCQYVRDQGKVWSWTPESEYIDTLQRFNRASIIWHDDPSLFGLPGTAGTIVRLRDMVGNGYI